MVQLNDYNQQQAEAILIVREHLEELLSTELDWLKKRIHSYLEFRSNVASFQKSYFADVCSQKCFTSQTSACCGREGILTFFADVFINLLLSTEEKIDTLLQTLLKDTGGYNCVYLNEAGCLWTLKPIVCEMFLCDHAKNTVLAGDDILSRQWEEFRQQERLYTWPAKPVLFDELEIIFIEAGFDSPLMYLNRSPGLLRLKAKQGLVSQTSVKTAGSP